MEKYYTPTLDEFYIGFEYEYRYEVGNWTEIWKTGETFTNCWIPWQKSSNPFELDYGSFDNSSPLSVFDEKEMENRFRAKYLDKEDIESLGWKYNDGSVIHLGFVNLNYPDLFLEFWFNDNRIVIHNREQYEDNFTYFNGMIKNKSELKKLMKQLNIE